jgi:hypothetical protein
MKFAFLFFLAAAQAIAADLILTWTDNSNNEAGFIVERAPGAAAATATTFAEVARTGVNVATYTDRNLPESTEYTYRVRAWNQAGMSAPSATATGKTSLSIPGAPTDLKIRPNDPSAVWNTPPPFRGKIDMNGYALELDTGSVPDTAPTPKTKKPKKAAQ